MYQIIISKKVEKFLDQLNNVEYKRILNRIEKLQENPMHYLELKGDTWVEKAGRSGYRIAVEIKEQEKIVEIIFIQKRSKFYEQFNV